MNNNEAEKRAALLLNYKLFSFKQLITFLKFSRKTSKDLSKLISRSKYSILIDMLYSNLRYGAMDNRDYLLFEFYRKNGNEKNKFLTKRRYYQLIKRFDKETFINLMNKEFMYRDYDKFIDRKWILVGPKSDEKEIYSFLSQFETVIIKPLSSEQGKGIYKLQINNANKVSSFISATKSNYYLIEEILENCNALNQINSTSLNTVRVYTIRKYDGNVEIISAALRCGCLNSEVDNWGAGGVGYNINLDLGIIDMAGIDKKGNQYCFHPYTEFKMLGFEIPYWSDIKRFSEEVIRHNPKVVYAGLDIAVTPYGIKLVEINFPGGHDFLQAIDKIGKYDKIRSIFE